MSDLYMIQTWFRVYLDRLRVLREEERGMTTETVIITALLAALAVLVVGIIAKKVTDKANSIDTGG